MKLVIYFNKINIYIRFVNISLYSVINCPQSHDAHWWTELLFPSLSPIVLDVRSYSLYVSPGLPQPLPPRRGEVGSGVANKNIK
jgi:hypothetical protein